MTNVIKYKKPILTKYNKMSKLTNTSLALEGTAIVSDCTLGRCGTEPPPIKG